MKEYVKNMKKYVKDMKESLPLYIGSRTFRNLSLYRLWDLEKLRAPPSYSLLDLENFREVSLFCLLYMSSKLSL